MLVAVFLVLVLVLAGVTSWNGRAAVVVLNETGCGLDVLSVNLNGLECSFRDVAPRSSVLCMGHAKGDGYVTVSFGGEGCDHKTVKTDEYANALFGWQGVLLLRADGTLGIAEVPR
ncbi:hypothetical protein BON30_21000 [Cystobacter ferrugineus]|uniref:Uncharacterized protein n=2 Tax=Cystobacter ferrugineus TaxID=83449 RepID=A0A1L9B8Y9_9BACT|nr:hypothetical protein BON30_21000 [Cystobacter ferrugineus]